MTEHLLLLTSCQGLSIRPSVGAGVASAQCGGPWAARGLTVWLKAPRAITPGDWVDVSSPSIMWFGKAHRSPACCICHIPLFTSRSGTSLN